MSPRLDFGIDRLPQQAALLARLRSRRVGVLAHAASVNRQLVHLCEVLATLDVTPAILFGPEHGFAATAQDMDGVDDTQQAGGPQVVSLYGDSLEDLVPQAQHLRNIDVLVIDLCDVGSRYYTYVWTALIAVRAAAELGVHCVILDRPNPIGGHIERAEGATVREGYRSFVGWEKVPIRHSLTIGEMVALHAANDGLALGPDGALSVVGVEGWTRDHYADDWDRPFVLPSPNMPTLDTALVYPGGCLIEGTNLSEGRGHTRPFEIFGAPWLDGDKLARDLHALQLDGFVARPLSFEPTFHKYGRRRCGGVQIHVGDRDRFRPVAVYAAILTLAHHQTPRDFAFRTERYEFVDDIPAFDLLTGSAQAREAIEAGESAAAVSELVSKPDAQWPAHWRRAQQRAASADAAG